MGAPCTGHLLAYKRTMEDNMGNQPSALSYPKATCNPATEEIANIDFEIEQVESQIVEDSKWHLPDSALAESAHMQSFQLYFLPLDQLSSFSPAFYSI